MHHSGGTICEPVDVPVNKRHLDMVYSHIRYNDQAFMGSVTQPERAADSVEMARILFGADFLEQHCVILGNVNVNSPLVWDNAMTGAIRAYAEANQAPVVVPFILGGAMGPVTLAGDIAQAHAETMVGVALGQLVRPGLAGDLRQLPVVDGAAVGRRRRSARPSRRSGRSSSASWRAGSGLPLRCAGRVHGVEGRRRSGDGGVDDVDDVGDPVRHELRAPLGRLAGGRAGDGLREVRDGRRLLRRPAHAGCEGVSLDDDEFALDGFLELGPGKHFFSAQHTLRHYETAFYDSPTADNNSFEQWRDAGETRTEERAAAIVAKTLAEYEPPPLDEAVDEALRDFIDRRRRRCPTCGIRKGLAWGKRRWLGALADDPLLQPFTLKHLTLRNRVFSSSHEPAYSEDGMPKDRYRLYHVEKAKGGIGMTMTAGSAVVAEDSPPAFGNLHAYDDAIVPWIRRMTDEVHEHGAACMIQLTHLGRRTGWAQDDWLPVVAPSPLREPAHRAIPKEAEDWDIDRIVGKYADAAERMQAGGMDGVEIESYGHLVRPVLVAADQPARPTSTAARSENRLRFGWRVLRAIRERVGPDFIVGIRMAVDETVPGGIDAADRARDPRPLRGRRADRLRQRHPRLHRRRRRR